MRLLNAALVAACLAVTLGASAPDPTAPQYDSAGKLLYPATYREWIFLSSGIDMSYSRLPSLSSDHMFNNVFVPQQAYAAFLKTGTWPDHTMLVLENRSGATKASINRRGVFQTDMMGMEVHVKDTARFKSGWAFFGFDGQFPAAVIPTTEDCYACHQSHAAVDTTFVQFYPTLLPIATQKGTLSPGYLADTK